MALVPEPQLAVAQGGLERQFELHRSELTGYCYRMLGSPFEAEDAVQDTFLRAWRGFDRVEGRGAPGGDPTPRSLVSAESDPAELVAERDTIRLAFVAALQHLPARQRAVLILCEVLRWKASEVAELLDTSVASVNSALQRARATIEERNLEATDAAAPMDATQQEFLARYVDAFQRYDVKE